MGKHSGAQKPPAAAVRTYTVFLASPSADTLEARRGVAEAVRAINLDPLYRDQVRLDLRRWDDPDRALALSAECNAQVDVVDQVADPAECDLVIGLWRHTMGGRLPLERFPHPDGRPWHCTEWEVARALEGLAVGRVRSVWRCRDMTPFPARSPKLTAAERQDLAAREEAVFGYFEALNPDPSCQQHSINEYNGDADLAQRIGPMLREWLKRQLERDEPDAAAAATSPADAPRELELRWLNEQLATTYARHERLYVPVAGRKRASRSMELTLAGLRMPTDVLLRRFQLDDVEAGSRAGDAAEPTTFDDVLTAYRKLSEQRRRLLAVLGEPGAGKTFSVERIAWEKARAAQHDPRAPLPLLVRLGSWTEEKEPLKDFIVRKLDEQMTGLGAELDRLRDAGRAMLLLDGLNEVPPSQRSDKAAQVRRLASDGRWAALLISCRERDFEADFRLPFDTLMLQPLTPLQIHRFLVNAFTDHLGDADAGERAGLERFWRLAGGRDMASVWATWQQAGASWEQFWTAEEVPKESPNVYGATSGAQDELWRRARNDRRGLLHLAANPYLLTVMTALPKIPYNRAQLFEGFLKQLHAREEGAYLARGDDPSAVPPFNAWRAALVALARAMQENSAGKEAGAEAGTTLKKAQWPAQLTPTLANFAIDASVLQRSGADELRFTHQLLQESLASQVLLDSAADPRRPATAFWPLQRWWQRNGWEVVAELAAEACGRDQVALQRLLNWLACANPEVAAAALQRAGSPELPAQFTEPWAQHWLPRMTDVQAEPSAQARAAIGRALGLLGLDRRRGVGLRIDRVPDIDWVDIPATPAFVYQRGRKQEAVLSLPAFRIARYPVTHSQFQAFIAAGGYRDDRWWQGLAQRPKEPAAAGWSEPNAPRERVNWFEAMAFCRWLSEVRQEPITLPSERQWERAAAGPEAAEYPWGQGYRPGFANCWEDDESRLGRRSAVGLFPQGRSKEGVLDLAGNVWEWCLDPFGDERDRSGEPSRRVLRGGAWSGTTESCRAGYRLRSPPGGRTDDLGFRVVCCPIVGP